MVISASYKRLYILVEGLNDERFVDSILKPIFEGNYAFVKTYKYAEKDKKTIRKFIKSIHSMDADFICLADLDNSPCTTHRKSVIKTKKLGSVEDSRIMIAKKDMDSWYLAGINDACCRRFRISIHNTTDNIDKRQFKRILERSKLGFTLDCRMQILQNYDLSTAVLRNQSFYYFYQKYLTS